MKSAVPSRMIDDYVLGPMLGKGCFGHVRIAKKMSDPNYSYAIKYMKIGKPNTKEILVQSLERESILQKLNHSNILRIYQINSEGIYEKNVDGEAKIPVVYAIMQLARSGDLFDFVASSGGLSEPVARFYFCQIINALEYIHSLGIAHRDMKPENVLLDQNYNGLLTDFGLSKSLSEVGFTTQDPIDKVGTERCMSPELYGGAVHSPIKDDLFALGYLLFMLVARHPPFMSASLMNEYYKLLKENKVLEYWKAIDSLHQPKWCSDEFKHLITIMLTFDMTIRPSIPEIRAHPWMKGPVPTEAEIISEFEKRQTNTLEYQKTEARKRKEKKLCQNNSKPSEKIKKLFAPHHLKRSVAQASSLGDDCILLKILKEFGEPKKHKPTILMSQESVQDIELGLLSFFSAAKSVKINQKKYKVYYILL